MLKRKRLPFLCWFRHKVRVKFLRARRRFVHRCVRVGCPVPPVVSDKPLRDIQ